MNATKSIAVVLLAGAMIAGFAFAGFGQIPGFFSGPFAHPPAPQKQNFNFKEGPVLTPIVTVGPFDIHRRYRSMEGPFVDKKIRMGDLIAAKSVAIPESMIRFTENGDKTTMGASVSIAGRIPTLPDASAEPPKLYWVKGFKLEVLNERGQIEPTAEFICHFNLDVDRDKRNEIFTESTPSLESRLLTITQGQTEVSFPDGFGVPVATDETWRFFFQVANRTTDAHRRMWHRLTLYMIPDKALVQPITALNWFVPYVTVVVDKNTQEITDKEKQECPLCYGTARGLTAPNAVPDTVENDTFGRKITGHWVVPPGKRTWTSIVRERGFGDRDILVHAAWSHIHPCCTSISLVKISDKDRQTMLSSTARTITNPGLQIKDIDYFSSKEGVRLPKGFKYETDITYDNNTGKPLDSMATMGIFYEDNEFARPKWVYDKDCDQFCGMLKPSSTASLPSNRADLSAAAPAQKGSAASENSGGSGGADSTPVFNTTADGPLLTKAKLIKVQTSDGILSFTLEPKWAPKTATQMAKLFANHVFDGTEIARYEPNFIFQISLAESKIPGAAALTMPEKKLIRRIPLEVNQQLSGQLKHIPGVLSMAREDNDTLGNTTSFSILIGNAAHLDTKYTIFGKLTDNPVNQQTLKNMASHWPKHPSITKTL